MSEAIGTQLQLLRGSAGTIVATFYNDDGAAADPGVTSVSVADEAGTVIIASIAAGGSGTTRTLAYSGTNTALLDRWVVTWVTTAFGTLTTRLEVVGAFLFSVAEARTFDDRILSDTTKYPTVAIEDARASITDWLTRVLGYSPIPRYSLDVLDGSGTVRLFLPAQYIGTLRSVASRTSGGTLWAAFDSATLADVFADLTGQLTRETLGSWTTGTENWRIGYEHGRWTQIPTDLKRAALTQARYELVGSNLTDRAISITTEFGTEQRWTPGLSARGTAVSALPYVDSVVRDYAQQRLAVA